MKKITACIIFAMAMAVFPTPVGANSGPVFWQGYPSSEVISIEENSPIQIKKENLLFDFSDWDGSFYAPNGKVTAAYEMVNPTNVIRSVEMAFPLIGTLDNFPAEDIVIKADDRVLPYEVYFGEVVDSYGSIRQEGKGAQLDFAAILDTITVKPFEAENFRANEIGKHYIIEVQPTTDQRINFTIDFAFDSEKTKVLTNGFNRYERNGEKIRIAAGCQEPRTLEIFVLGEDIELVTKAFKDGALQEETSLFTHQTSVQEVELKAYLMEFIKNLNPLQSGRAVFDKSYMDQLYNLYAKALDQAFTRNMGYSAEDDLRGQGHYKRIMTLVYTVVFPQDSKKEVSVSYSTTGTMDKTKTAEPLYKFDYILNPAENWSAFNNLNIKIIPPQDAPYVVASNIELVRGADHGYTATLAELPKEDFSFTLYSAERITLTDKAKGYLNSSFGYFAPLVIGAAVLLLAIAFIIMALKLKRLNNPNR